MIDLNTETFLITPGLLNTTSYLPAKPLKLDLVPRISFSLIKYKVEI